MPRYSLAARVAAAKKFGLAVEVVPGAETRGSDVYNPGCYVGHHTAGPKIGDRPSLNICVNGRTGLAGPLCEDFMPRKGGLIIVACGRSNNAGLGGFRGIVGNSGTMACEAEDDGDGLWTAEQLRDYPRIVASGLYMLGLDASWYCSHRTWALVPPSYPGRKIDPSGIEDSTMRTNVAALLKAGGSTEEVPLQLDDGDRKWITNEIKRIGLRIAATTLTGTPNTVVSAEEAKGFAEICLARVAYLMTYGDNSNDSVDRQTRPDNMQKIRTELATFFTASASREQGLVDLVTKLSQSSGVPISREEIMRTLDAAVDRGFAGLDLHIVPGTAELPVSPVQ